MIYAVDFDGTLCSNAWPEIGEPNTSLINFLRKERDKGAEIILWTMRENEKLDQAIKWCKEKGLEFDAVNDNVESQKRLYANNPRKVYADSYIDDHNIFVTKTQSSWDLFSAHGANEFVCMKEEQPIENENHA